MYRVHGNAFQGKLHLHKCMPKACEDLTRHRHGMRIRARSACTELWWQHLLDVWTRSGTSSLITLSANLSQKILFLTGAPRMTRLRTDDLGDITAVDIAFAVELTLGKVNAKPNINCQWGEQRQSLSHYFHGTSHHPHAFIELKVSALPLQCWSRKQGTKAGHWCMAEWYWP